MADSDAWTTIESDPGVFTELIREMGVRDVQVEELYSLDSESLNALRPLYGLIFLFKWQKEADGRAVMPEAEARGRVFFARQVITNACATQALLAILLNRQDIDLGRELTDFRAFTADFDAEMKGHAISNSESIRRAHNSFRPPNPILPDEALEDAKAEDAFHFIAYLPIGGQLYELDGLKAGPIHLGACSEEDWLAKVQPIIQQRVERYSASEIRFNLLALIKDRRAVLRERITTLEGAGAAGSPPEQLLQLQEELRQEEEKYVRWHRENVRRKHNFIPLLYNLLRVLGEEDRLGGLIELARKEREPPKD